MVKLQHNIITRAVLARTEANMVMVITRKKKMTKSILAASLLVIGVEAGSNFADSLAECSAVQELNICLREVGIRIMIIVVDGNGGDRNDDGDHIAVSYISVFWVVKYDQHRGPNINIHK